MGAAFSESYALIGGVIAAIGTVWAAYRRVLKWYQHKVSPRLDLFDEVMLLLRGRDEIRLPENPAIVVAEAIPGALERLAEIEKSQASTELNTEALWQSVNRHSEQVEYLIGEVHEVKAEVKPNGGGSIKDTVNRIEERLAVVEDVLSTRSEAEHQMWSAIEAVAKSVPPREGDPTWPDTGTPGIEDSQ